MMTIAITGLSLFYFTLLFLLNKEGKRVTID